ncbi:MAG: MBL fold metallo-hydrolase [Thermoplasmata archaeon]|nr:MBL fold metallo-hydrolase [Thermoplasmata archaeon]
MPSGPVVTELGSGRRLLDLRFRGEPGLIASYLVPQSDGYSIVETGPTTCHGSLLAALSAAGVEPPEVRRVFLTHIHLDHAGGAGSLVEALPAATFYVHELGRRHLLAPERLVESARRAWGPAADALWGPMVAIPSERLIALQGGESFEVAGGHLEAIATPGHAKHHLSFFDSGSRGLFTGDSAGVRLAGSWRPRPAVPPPDLDLELLFGSLDRMGELAPERLLYSHFGARDHASEELQRYRAAVSGWRDAALAEARIRPEIEAIATVLREYEAAAARAAEAVPPDERRGEMISSYDLAAQGLLRYFQQRGLLSG